MKRLITLSSFILLVLSLVGCSFSLAEDITPPPGYATPTPLPGIGPLYPEQPPVPARGAALYAEKCAPCHGEQGLGNGPMAANLPVAVPAIGLAEIARRATPAEWYQIVSEGRMQRGMPPFLSLSPQERWDVVAYTFMLSLPSEDIQEGKALFEQHCASCHRPGGLAEKVNFADQAYMAQMSNAVLYQVTARGKGQMPAFADRLTERELWAVVAYLRSLSFDLSQPLAQAATPIPTQETPMATPVPTQQTPIATPAPGQETPVETPATADTTPAPSPEEATSVVGGFEVRGQVENQSGVSLPPDLQVTLYLYDLNTNQIVETRQQNVAEDGSFRFPNVSLRQSDGYWVEVEYQGVFYTSPFAHYDGSSQIEIPLTVYEVTNDLTLLKQDALHIFLDFSSPDVLRVEQFYVLSNPSQQTVLMPTDGASLPFIRLPDGAESVQLAPSQDSADFLPAQEGIALPPSANPFGVIVSFTLPYERNMTFSQPLVLPVSSVTVIATAGTRLMSEQFQDGGQQTFNGQVYQIYQARNLPAGELSFRLSAPSTLALSGVTAQPWLIALGALGIVLIVIGAVLFWRDRQRTLEEDVEETSAEESPDVEALLDAMIALDEQFRQGELERSVYEKRRAILKEQVREAISRRK